MGIGLKRDLADKADGISRQLVAKDTSMQKVRDIASFRSVRALALGAALALGSVAAEGADNPQKLLFDTPYLQQLKPPSSLNYTYKHEAADPKQFGKPFTDTIAVDLAKPDNPAHVNQVTMRIFTGERARKLGPNVDMKGNPIIMIFLERDLWEMKRRVGGEPIFYRNKIRRALRDAATVEKVDVNFKGKTVPGHKVTITPFAGETQNRRMERFLKKRYEFVVADAVPGGYVKVRSSVPAEDGGAALVADELTYSTLD